MMAIGNVRLDLGLLLPQHEKADASLTRSRKCMEKEKAAAERERERERSFTRHKGTASFKTLSSKTP